MAAALSVPSPARADTIEVDVTKTGKEGLNRYCFRVTNDDNDESEDLHDKNICSFYVRVLVALSAEDQSKWRDTIDGPDEWDPYDKEQGVPNDDVGIPFRWHWIKWSTSRPLSGCGLAPGDVSGDFCFVVKGTVDISKVYTDYHTLFFDDPGILSNPTPPNQFQETTDANDTDYLTDSDGDGIPDKFDATPSGADPDADGQDDGTDNCPQDPNPDQTDTDGDGLGDDCDPCPNDPDCDGDGLDDGLEVLVKGTDPTLADTDLDVFDDKIESDQGSNPLDPSSTPEQLGDGTDNDGFGLIDENFDVDDDSQENLLDNCPETPNPDQGDLDGDGVGDACDLCPDTALGDEVDADGCPIIAIPTLSHVGLISMAVAMLILGVVLQRRRTRSA